MKKIYTLAAIATLAFAANASAQDEGEAVYNKSCMFCHASGVGGAPRAHQDAAWKSLMDKGMDALLKSVKDGKGNMPAGGMCSSCSDDEFKKAIAFMAQKK
ncbi:cytochrome c5 family protein [Shewanella yunxiaonensis]|uniref:Cytochrome c5 family protein n=1 Tax=Shewanella yunxiaonensis TaxID=2829809 RepID=A0ABX7YTJ7_9GAMM|nr:MULTISPECIES: c-type cytochrome [Shewanella]MDF0533298.1 c-type cytochrome [Shewanella sp. A32]QUN05690.1 cytochrome c5 family protein [Shewanella yunxiaonensis]